MNAVAGACLVVAAVLLLVGSPNPPLRGSAGSAPRAEVGLLRRARVPLAVGAGIGAWLFLGGVMGLLGGAGATVLAWHVLGQVEDPAVVRRRRELERDLPVAVHLLGAVLGAGASVDQALGDVAAALPGPVAEELTLLRRRLDLGVDPTVVWRSVAGPLTPLGRALGRAADSGASVVDTVDRLADELGATARARGAARARAVEVRAAAPLGLCFLPAFVLLGVVPMVAGVFGSLHLLG